MKLVRNLIALSLVAVSPLACTVDADDNKADVDQDTNGECDTECDDTHSKCVLDCDDDSCRAECKSKQDDCHTECGD